MLLLTGPPGSGKTQLLLEQVRDAARRRAQDICLLTPTATMAEHLSHELAREGEVISDGLIQTLHRFLKRFPTSFKPASSALIDRLIRLCLERDTPAAFRDLAARRGFQQDLATLVGELSDSGIRSHQLSRLLETLPVPLGHGAALSDLISRVGDELISRGRLTRGDHLRAVGEVIKKNGLGPLREVLFAGFFTFTPAEMDLIRAVADQADVTVALPQWSGVERTRDALLRLGFREQVLTSSRPAPAYEIVRAAHRDAEVSEVARRIVAEVEGGRRFREIGVVLRGSQPYGAAIESAFGRFGIPARYYFGRSVARARPVLWSRYVIESRLAGWDLEKLLAAIQLENPSSARDRLDYAARERLPAAGFNLVRELCEKHGSASLAASLEVVASWPDTPAPPSIWAGRFAQLSRYAPAPVVRDRVSHEQAHEWRWEQAALAQFMECAREAAEVFDDDDPAPLSEFWEECRRAIEREQLYLRDQRHNVVHVMDAHEARQWELPLVFVCGLVEEEFPRRHVESPLLPDEARRAFRRKGFALVTATERESEEKLLFDLALTRGRERVVLSFPAHNSSGDPTLPSFLLTQLRVKLGLAPESDSRPRPVRPASRWPRAAPPPPRIRAEDLLAALADSTSSLTPSSIERFLSCPFQFFTEQILKLDELPAEPRDRFDARVQGTIIHAALATLDDCPAGWAESFGRIFAEHIAAQRILPGYQTECIRLEMIRSLERWFEINPLPVPESRRREANFKMDVAPDLAIRGRVDRVDIYTGERAVVIDYKYSRPDRLRELTEGAEQGLRVQPGLYLAAARRGFGLHPVGMFYSAVRNKPGWDGWVLGSLPVDAKTGTKCEQEFLDQMIDDAVARGIEVAGEIRAGRIEPAPADEAKCAYCPRVDICRWEETADSRTAGGGS